MLSCQGALGRLSDTAVPMSQSNGPETSNGPDTQPTENPTGPASTQPNIPEVPKECAVQKTPARLWRLSGRQYLMTLKNVALQGRDREANNLPSGLVAPFTEISANDRFSTLDGYSLTTLELESLLATSRIAALRAATDMKANFGSNCLKFAKNEMDFTNCVRATIEKVVGPLAWDRPLTKTEVDAAVSVATKTGWTDMVEAFAAAFQSVLVSPNALFRAELGSELDAFGKARAMAFALTDAPPDAVLYSAAEQGQLTTVSEVGAQVQRLLNSPRGVATAQRFVREYYKLELARSVPKEASLYPFHNVEGLIGDTEALVSGWLLESNGAGFVTKLLTSDEVAFSSSTKLSYGLEAPTRDRIRMRSNIRAGLLTQPSTLTAFSHPDSTDIVRRGKFIAESLLCQTVPPLPIDSVPPLPNLGPNATGRELLAVHSKGSCAGCHQLMDSPGLGLEGFDHLGRKRSTEAGKPVDESGLLAQTDVDGPFVGAVELSQKLAASARVKACFTSHLFQFYRGRAPRIADGCVVDEGAKRLATGAGLHEALTAFFTDVSFEQREAP